MPRVSEECPGVCLSELIAVITLHMHQTVAQKTAVHKSSHTPRCVVELSVMAYCQLEASFIRECDQFLGLLLANCEWLLYIDMAS